MSNLDFLSGIGLSILWSNLRNVHSMVFPGQEFNSRIRLAQDMSSLECFLIYSVGYIPSSVLSRIAPPKGLFPSRICRSRVCPVSCLSQSRKYPVQRPASDGSVQVWSLLGYVQSRVCPSLGNILSSVLPQMNLSRFGPFQDMSSLVFVPVYEISCLASSLGLICLGLVPSRICPVSSLSHSRKYPVQHPASDVSVYRTTVVPSRI